MPTGAGVSGGGPGGHAQGQVYRQIHAEESGPSATHKVEGAAAVGGVGVAGAGVASRLLTPGADRVASEAVGRDLMSRVPPQTVRSIRALTEHSVHALHGPKK